MVITPAGTWGDRAVGGQRPRTRPLRHGPKQREELAARLDVARCRTPGRDPAAQIQIAAHTAGFSGVHVNGVGFEAAFKAMRADLNICMVARKRSRFVEGPHDGPGRLSCRRPTVIHAPSVPT